MAIVSSDGVGSAREMSGEKRMQVGGRERERERERKWMACPPSAHYTHLEGKKDVPKSLRTPSVSVSTLIASGDM